MSIRLFYVAILTVLFPIVVYGAEDPNPVVGRARDFVLRDADAGRLIGYQPAEIQGGLQNDPDQRAEFIRQILLTRMVAEKARSAGFDKKPEMKEQLGYVIDQYIAKEYLDKIIAANITVSEEDLKKYYEEHNKEFLIPGAIKARHIFFEAPKDTSPAASAKAKAEEVLTRLKKGEDFAKLAKEFSQDSDTAAKGGELGWISPGKTNSPDFEKAVLPLKVNEISGIIETPFGFHIVRIDERKEERTATFDEAKNYIMERLKYELGQKNVTEFLDRLSMDTGLEVINKGLGTRDQEPK